MSGGGNELPPNLEKGWIKLHRAIEDWEWYQDANTFRVFMHLLIRANHKDKTWQGIEIKKGQTLATRGAISSALGISEQSVRSSCYKLEKSQNLTSQLTSKGKLITICNWDTYQFNEEPINQRFNRQPTSDQPAINQRSTSNKNDKNEKNEKKIPPNPQNGGIRHQSKSFLPTIPDSLKTPDFESAWQEWQSYRKEAKKSITPSTARKQLAALEKMGEVRAIAAINNSIEKGYQGIFEGRSNQRHESKLLTADDV